MKHLTILLVFVAAPAFAQGTVNIAPGSSIQAAIDMNDPGVEIAQIGEVLVAPAWITTVRVAST